jgi:carboxypeptidase PM20D1
MTTGQATTSGAEMAIERLRALVRIPTISRPNARDVDWAEFERFIAALAAHYPRAHEMLDVERVGGYSLLYRWRGTDDGDPTTAGRTGRSPRS